LLPHSAKKGIGLITAHAGQSYAGTRLGRAICERVVTRRDSTITADAGSGLSHEGEEAGYGSA
jgi:hypothetical protein